MDCYSTNVCSRNILTSYEVYSTRSERVYVIVEFVFADDDYIFELRKDSEEEQSRRTIRMTSDDFLHIACNTASSGRNRCVETKVLPDGGMHVMDSPYAYNTFVFNCETHGYLKTLCRYIMEDIDIMKPHITKEEIEVNGLYAVRRFFFAYIRDLHERNSEDPTSVECASKILKKATLDGLGTFITLCGLTYAHKYDMKKIIGDEDDMIRAMVKDEIPPTTRFFIHYTQCNNDYNQ